MIDNGLRTNLHIVCDPADGASALIAGDDLAVVYQLSAFRFGFLRFGFRFGRSLSDFGCYSLHLLIVNDDWIFSVLRSIFISSLVMNIRIVSYPFPVRYRAGRGPCRK